MRRTAGDIVSLRIVGELKVSFVTKDAYFHTEVFAWLDYFLSKDQESSLYKK